MTAAIFRRDLLTEIGPLDERFQSYLEDVDFGLRCALRGRTGVYVPAAVAHHQGSATFGAWQNNTVRLISRNQILLVAKHFRSQPRWPILVGQLLWGLLAMRHGCGWAWVRGKWEGVRIGGIAFEPAPVEKVAKFIRDSERRIFEIQSQIGFERYWRAYFWLLGR